MQNKRHFVYFLFVVLLVSTLFVANPSAASTRQADWRFDVLLNDKRIGFHNFSLSGDADRQVLTTEAKFDVKVLFINAFRYRHDNTETWSGGCLDSIDASTDNNGERLSVRGQRDADVLRVEGLSGPLRLDECVQTFAYWNPDILESTRLLNSQTGALESVSISTGDIETIDVDGNPVEARRYRLLAESGAINLWYSTDESRRWLALEAPAKGGRSIRYVPTRVPAAADLAS